MVLGLLRGMDPQWPDNIICPALLLLWLLLLLRGEWMLLEWVTHRLESIIIYLVPGVGGGGWDNGVFLCSRFVLELVLSWTSCEEWIEVFFEAWRVFAEEDGGVGGVGGVRQIGREWWWQPQQILGRRCKLQNAGERLEFGIVLSFFRCPTVFLLRKPGLHEISGLCS